MKKPFLWVVGFLGILAFTKVGLAQVGPQDERRLEEKALAALEPTELAILKGEERLVLDYGIWINYLYSNFNDDDNNTALEDSTDYTHAIDSRLWFRATLRPPLEGDDENEHSLYLRLKDKQTWRDPDDSNGRYDNNGPRVDYLYLTLDIRPFWLLMGRRYFSVGEGIAYSNVHDGIELDISLAAWTWIALVSRTLPHEDNMDLSVPGGKDSGRTFYGLEGKYIGILNHGLYGYLLLQRDDAQERPEHVSQDFDYDSEYWGIGSEGKLFENLRYSAEVIFESGKSFTSGVSQRKEINAWASDISLNYDVQLPTQPSLYAEYAFGSGDSDRTNVTNTINGNTVGKDNNFLYFGYLPTGYALSPRLSNIHVIKAGFSFKPLEKNPLCKELTTSFDFYRFLKDEPKGGIYDTDASQNDRDIGYEIDFTLSWQVLSDLSLIFEYGHFEPGDAYPLTTNDDAEYLSLGVTITF